LSALQLADFLEILSLAFLLLLELPLHIGSQSVPIFPFPIEGTHLLGTGLRVELEFKGRLPLATLLQLDELVCQLQLGASDSHHLAPGTTQLPTVEVEGIAHGLLSPLGVATVVAVAGIV